MRRLLLAVGVAALGLSVVGVSVVSARDVAQQTTTTQDLVVAGGLDGRVFAMDAWTGDVLWMFDSGGPMVDSAACGGSGGGAGRSTAADHAVATQTHGQLSTGLSQMVPSYDGRLYHIDGASVRELGVTMLDLIHANGPVRLARDGDADLLLFGEKTTAIFALDAARGVVQPLAQTSPALLFGRAEFKTRAVHARNMSAAQCFTIAEYFLQFTDQSKCDKRGDAAATVGAPQILVVPKDPDAAHPDEEESTIAAYDPWTNKQLWELQIPKFDVVAVFGVSPNRGASFFKWSVEGPSSSMQMKKDLVVSGAASGASSASKGETTVRPMLSAEEQSNESKHLVKTVNRDLRTMESEFRLRLLDGNYYLEPNDDDDESVKATSSGNSEAFNANYAKRKRRVFWESMESGGKKGVFITYYHVGAMTLGTMVGCVLIAWGFYVKGLSASGAMNAIQQDFMPSGHVHQLTIEQPGRDKITISSSITRALLLEAAMASGYMRQQVPLLENGDETFTGVNNVSNTSDVKLDPATEAMLLEKFTKMVAMEAAAALSGHRFSNSSLMQLKNDPDASSASTMSSSTLTLVSDASTGRTHRPSLQVDDCMDLSVTTFEAAASRSNMTEDNEGRIIPVIEELETSSDAIFELEDRGDVIEAVAVTEDNLFDLPVQDEAAVLEETVSSAQSSAKPSEPWESETTGSCDSSKDASSSEEEESGSSASDDSESRLQGDEELTRESASAGEATNRRKSSNASSSESVSNEAEVLFPFVCQSRFANEFVELSALGKGGFGQVMLAENRLDGRKYAIKRVGLHLKNQTSKTLQKFLREVKILALLDHPHIVRYYQAWLEKVEEGTIVSGTAFSDGGSDVTGTVAPRNYSMSNLLAPISEMEYSNQQRSVASFYSNGSLGDDGGFEWERNSQDGDEVVDAWREEDLVSDTQPRGGGRKLVKHPSIIEPNQPPRQRKAARDTDKDDSSSYSMEKCDHWLYIQMQYCAGRNLGDYLALPTRTMELPKLLKIFTQIASAIAHVHSCGLIHRDLKPANIFVADQDGDSIKLGDFGLSRYAANVNLAQSTIEEQSSSAMFMNGGQLAQYSMSKWSMSVSNMSESQDITAGVGTYLYASPEQVAGKKYNAKTDMYSLGMILFELCHERFGTTMERYVTLRNARERIFPGEFVWRKKCPEIMEMLDKLLHHDPMQRPDASDVVQWSQELYELSLAQHHHSTSALRSPVHHSRSFQGTIPGLSLEQAGSAFSLQVEARMDSGSDDSNSGSSGERRIPNHNLLKELCDVIVEVSGGRMEIKKCGLHLQDVGAQILDFVLDPHLTEDEKENPTFVASQKAELMRVLEALPGVHTVRLDT